MISHGYYWGTVVIKRGRYDRVCEGAAVPGQAIRILSETRKTPEGDRKAIIRYVKAPTDVPELLAETGPGQYRVQLIGKNRLAIESASVSVEVHDDSA
jgi:hypothetical protein